MKNPYWWWPGREVPDLLAPRAERHLEKLPDDTEDELEDEGWLLVLAES